MGFIADFKEFRRQKTGKYRSSKSHVLDSIDSETSAAVRQQNREIKLEEKRMEAEIRKMELENEKIERMQDLELRKAELKELRDELKASKDGGGGVEDYLMTMILNKAMNAPLPAAQSGVSNFATPPNGAQDIPAQEQQNQQTPQEQPINSRFTQEQLKDMIPKAFNTEQVTALQQLNLTDDEVLQLYDEIKAFNSVVVR